MPVKQSKKILRNAKIQMHVILVLVQLSSHCWPWPHQREPGWMELCEGRKSTLWMGGFDWHKATARRNTPNEQLLAKYI